MMRERIDCPVCEDGTLRPILYGLLVDGKLREKANRGEIVLGRRQVGQEAPDWDCSECGRRIKDPERRSTWR